MYNKSNRVFTYIAVLCVILYLTHGTVGCSYYIVSKRAENKSGKIGTKKGRLLVENSQLIEESPSVPVINLEYMNNGLIKATIEAHKKQMKDIRRIYEKISINKIYKPKYHLLEHIIAGIVTLGGSELLLLITDNKTEMKVDRVEEKVEGEIVETEYVVRNVKSPIPNIPVFFNCGPAGQHSSSTNGEGTAVLDLKPLMNQVVKDYNWIITATAEYEVYTGSNTIILNTADHRTMWNKPSFKLSTKQIASQGNPRCYVEFIRLL